MATLSIVLVLLSALSLGVSGGAALLPFRDIARREQASSWLAAGAAGVGILGTLVGIGAAVRPALAFDWSLPVGRFAVQLDALSAVFLLPIFLVCGLGSIYGLRYWPASEHPATWAKLRVFYGLLAGSMAFVVISRDAILFLMAWEVMALAAFFLVTTDDDTPEACRAGWIYLVATHVATLCLMAMFALMRGAGGSWALAPLPAPGGTAHWIFLLGLIGFGIKAGMMPLHVWLPSAHANAPSHVSAVMSGVMIKMGIYGIVRVSGLLGTPPVAWGTLVLVLGVISAVLGVAFAIGQHDLKRLLAYHSIENIGIILMGVGLALIGRSLGRADWIVLGLGGALFHVWNHGLFKSLLFLSAGAVIHATGTRDIDRLGGMAAAMPRTAMYFLIGAVAICGLPPLNGFASELLIYVGLLRTMGIGEGASWPAAALAVPALAMTGALAVACFVKVFGAVFLGERRSQDLPALHEAPSLMQHPMAVLAACCFGLGLIPAAGAGLLTGAAWAWAPDAGQERILSLVPLRWVSFAGVLLLACVSGAYVWLRTRAEREAMRTVGTWDCGYARPTARMQYTSSSFAQFLVALFGWALRPRVHPPRINGFFPATSHFESHVDDTVLDGVILPAAGRLERIALRLRFLQHGRVQLYILYVLVALVGLLLWALPIRGVIEPLFM